MTMARVLLALAEKDKVVLTPFGEGLHYDLLIDEGERFVRVQCKTGRLLKNDTIIFNNYSQTNQGTKKYGASVDAYGVYCPQNSKVYLIPTTDCAGYKTTLRLKPAPNGIEKGIRYAERYEL